MKSKTNPILDQDELWNVTKTCPPCMARIMCVKSGKGVKPRLNSIMHIVEQSGLSKRLVQRLVVMTTWDGVKHDVQCRFLIGCNVDIIHKTAQKGSTKMTRYYFYRNYIQKNMPHLTGAQRARFYSLMGWS